MIRSSSNISYAVADDDDFTFSLLILEKKHHIITSKVAITFYQHILFAILQCSIARVRRTCANVCARAKIGKKGKKKKENQSFYRLFKSISR